MGQMMKTWMNTIVYPSLGATHQSAGVQIVTSVTTAELYSPLVFHSPIKTPNMNNPMWLWVVREGSLAKSKHYCGNLQHVTGSVMFDFRWDSSNTGAFSFKKKGGISCWSTETLTVMSEVLCAEIESTIKTADWWVGAEWGVDDSMRSRLKMRRLRGMMKIVW
jgi:hypothetical protein